MTYGMSDPLPFGKLLGNIRIITPLDRSMVGKKIVIYFQPRYSMRFDIKAPEFGPIDQLKGNVLKSNLMRLFVCVFVSVLFFTAMLLLIIQVSNHRTEDIKLTIHFMAFMILSMMWIVCSSDLPQFITNAAAPVSFISFVALSAMCVPFNGICKTIFQRGKAVFEVMWSIGLLLPLINVFGFITGVADPISLLPFTHVYILASSFLAFVYVLLQRKGAHSTSLLAGMMCLIASAVAGLLLFYIAPTKGYAPSVFALGFFMFFLMILKILWSRRIEQIKEMKFIDTYKSLAYSDVMTGLENRTSFEARFRSMQSENMQGKMVSIIVFDIRGIKDINDSIGHQAGDKMITGTSDIINRIFSSVGRCYRIGGDEFAVIMVDKPLVAEKYLDDFDKSVAEYNKYNAFPIKVDYGYAQKEWREDQSFFRELFKEADKAMYLAKNRNK